MSADDSQGTASTGSSPASHVPPAERRCTATSTRTGERCTAYVPRGAEGLPDRRCAGHSGLGIAANPQAFGTVGAQASAEARSRRAERRKTTFQSALEAEAVEHAEALAATIRALALDPQNAPSERLAAAKLLVERAHGKAVQPTEDRTAQSVDDLSLEDLVAIWREGEDEGA